VKRFSRAPWDSRASRRKRMSDVEGRAVWQYRRGEKVNKICYDLRINMKTLYGWLHKHDVALRTELKGQVLSGLQDLEENTQ